MKLSIAEIREETPRIRSYFLESTDGAALPETQAGAHIDVDLGALGTRSYSIMNPGDRDRYHIAVQREDEGDGGSRAMHALEVGASIETTAPKNDFPLAEGAHPTILLAGGIGITPLVGMAQTLSAAGHPFSFLYCGRSRADMAFVTGEMTLHTDDTAGPPDLGVLLSGLTKDTHLYVCGPKPMIEAAKSVAEARGLPSENVHFELFRTVAVAEGDQPFEVEIADTGQVFTIPPGKTIIEVLEDAGLDLMYDCQRGDCGICQTDVIEGEPDHRDVVLSDAEKVSGKVMQICVSRAKSAKLVLDL